MLKCQSHMIAAVARPRERAARAGRAEKRTYCQTSRADHGLALLDIPIICVKIISPILIVKLMLRDKILDIYRYTYFLQIVFCFLGAGIVYLSSTDICEEDLERSGQGWHGTVYHYFCTVFCEIKNTVYRMYFTVFCFHPKTFK